MDKKLQDSLSKIKLLICDIDGVLTDGSFVKRDVEVGISDGINVEILKGIKEGDKIKVWNSVEDETDDDARRRQDENSRKLED